jgi:hypothetical protein
VRATHVALPAVAGGFALALLVSADAGADTVLVADRAETSLPAHLDLTGAQYVNDSDGFSARLTVRDLRLRTSTLGFTITFPKSGRVFHVSATRTKAGKQTYLVSREAGGGKLVRTCSTFTTTWDDTQDRIDVHVPWSCLGVLPATTKVQGYLLAGKAHQDNPADLLRTVKVQYR